MANLWVNRSDLPAAAAVMAALHLGDPRPEALATLGDADWEKALQFCDRSRLTLPLGERAKDHMPGWVRERTGADFAKHGERLTRLMELYASLRERLGAQGIEFATLKGPAQSALSGIPPEIRVQYDADLYVPAERILAAREVLLGLGYESLTELQDFPTDHLPPLVLKTGWEWRGDFFDPEIPIALELHYQFWDTETERLAAPGVEEFWDRRTMRAVSGVMLPVLAPVDCLGYAALHLLKHLLRGSVTPFHVYELAHMLERQGADEDFWRDWERLHAPGLRRLEAVSFELALAWFGCELAPAAEAAIERLPPSILSWFGTFAAAPLVQQQQANKDELWLHLSLLESAGDRWRVARRRILPARLPGPVDAVYVPEGGMTRRRRWRRRIRYGQFVASRMSHHAAALPRTLGSGAAWWLRASGPGNQFWTFLGAAALFNFALFVFVL
ncbi:MAG TPA: nucleotidyltransferase family protein, partial [Bryobacteraceae bacterium]|nr:nucleotidyltransferase family protein [Bryobacteraceae bacterium]